MKEFSLPEIEGTREYFKKEGFAVEEARLGDLYVSYWVVPQKAFADLPDFAMRMTNTNPETSEVLGIFGVSDSVPQELRPYWAAHEIIEFTQIGINTKKRCVSAEEGVVGLVPDGLKDAYIAKRTEFFTNLVEFFRKDLKAGAGNYTKADFREAVTTRQYLRGLQKQRLAR